MQELCESSVEGGPDFLQRLQELEELFVLFLELHSPTLDARVIAHALPITLQGAKLQFLHS